MHSACVSARVCVCERERETERESGRSVSLSDTVFVSRVWLSVEKAKNKILIISAVLLKRKRATMRREQQREK